MLVIDPKSGDIIDVNDAAIAFYGYDKAQFTQLKIQSINQLSAEQVAAERIEAANQGRNYFIFQHKLRSGEVRTVQVFSSPFEHLGRTLLLSVIQDISAQRDLQQELWHYQSNLEQQVAMQTQAIETADMVKWLLMYIAIAILLGASIILAFMSFRLREAKKLAEKDSATLRAIFNAFDDYLVFTDNRHEIVSGNQKVHQQFPISWQGQSLYTFFDYPEDLTLVDNQIAEITVQIGSDIFPAEVRCEAVNDRQGKQQGFLYIIRNIRARLDAERELRLASTVFETTHEGVLVSDKQNRIQLVNRAFTDITGYEQHEVLGQTPDIFSSGRHDTAYFTQLYDTLNTQGHWEGEIWNRRKGGDIYPSWLTVSAVFAETGEIEMYVALFNDITSRKKNEQLMWQQANFDNLTGLANRHHYHNKFDQEIQRALREGSRLAICFIDLDRFKAVNDMLGHHIGDLLLVEAANRIRGCTRSSDTVARLGGDEFALLLPDINSIVDIEKVASKVLSSLHSPFNLEGHEAFVSGSMGITIYPDDGTERKILLRNADSAMYKAKEHGRNCFQFYTSAMHEHAKARSKLESALHKALINKELSIHYQPILNRHGQVCGAEALLRWFSPLLGQVSPAKFIPVSEELGLIVAMGEWVLYQACAQAKSWIEDQGEDFFISINVSSTQFKRQDIASLVAKVLRDTGLAPQYLTLEITETVLADNTHHTLHQLQALRELGVELAIDDFGTGYSSLSYLKRFPLTKLKIDREFVRDIPDDPEDCALVSAIISMAGNLNLKVIAEGVETQAQLSFLHSIECHYTQGFLHSKPISSSHMDALLERVNRPSIT
ncbi:diguanylate cyclase/phosphodiesterase (GGDEF & EAL domains) with PAS/PAC sensor(s) [Pseudoalteromonas luteoviolacea B = ATCC 29581]|nr:diguanylate cyclase/phosphodiesterase (GGDEF & EAL domains) with PAS/PAC sensor(s) [Pseudoalteromonas luteoviolacea B = ATCC 29581]